jgi:hypothetical protein
MFNPVSQLLTDKSRLHARLRLACDHLSTALLPALTDKPQVGAEEEQLLSKLGRMQEVLEGARGLRAEASERVVTRDEVERVLLVVEGKTKEVEKVEGALRGVRRVAEEERKAREVEAKKWRYAEMLKTTRQKQIDAKMSDQVNSLYQAVNSSLNNFV